MKHISTLILVGFITSLSLSLISCDTTAERELRRAEEAILAAEQYDAEEHATDDFTKAENLLTEAAELAKDNRIQEAREVAIKAKLAAEDAMLKAQERAKILEAEMDKIGR